MGDSLEAAVVSFSTGLLFVSGIALVRQDVRAGFRQIFTAINLKPQYAPDIPDAIISPMTIQKSIKSLPISLSAPENITPATHASNLLRVERRRRVVLAIVRCDHKHT